MPIIKKIILIIMIPMMTGCSLVIKGVYGIRNPQAFQIEDVKRWAKQNDYPENNLFLLDTLYFQFIEITFTGINKKQLSQPVLFFYVDSNRLLALTNNCQQGGFPNLKWNSYGEFDSIVPKTVCPLTGYAALSFSDISKYYIPIGESLINTDKPFIVLHLSNLINRQGKRLYKLVTKKYPNIPVYVVNNDTWFKYNAEF